MSNEVRDTRVQREALRGPDTRERARSRKRTEGQYKQYYEDVGTSTTPEAYKEFQAKEAEYQGNLSAQRKAIEDARKQWDTSNTKVSNARKQLTEAYSKIPTVKKTVDSSWSKAKSGFKPVRVVDASGNKVEGTYYLPKSAIPSLAKSLSGFEQRWVDDGKNYNISVRHNSGRIRGQEIHDALRGAEKDIKINYYKSAIPEVEKQLKVTKQDLDNYNTQLTTSETQLGEAKADIDYYTGKLTSATETHNKEIQLVKDEYNKKLENIKAIFGGMSVEKGKSGTATPADSGGDAQ